MWGRFCRPGPCTVCPLHRTVLGGMRCRNSVRAWTYPYRRREIRRRVYRCWNVVRGGTDCEREKGEPGQIFGCPFPVGAARPFTAPPGRRAPSVRAVQDGGGGPAKGLGEGRTAGRIPAVSRAARRKNPVAERRERSARRTSPFRIIAPFFRDSPGEPAHGFPPRSSRR